MKITKSKLKQVIKEEIENLLDDTKQASVDDTQANAAKHGYKVEKVPSDQFPGHSKMSGAGVSSTTMQKMHAAVANAAKVPKNQIIYLVRGPDDHIFFKVSKTDRYFKLRSQPPESPTANW